MKVLLIEDDISLNHTINENLNTKGYKVVQSFDAQHALSVLNGSFDCFIVDLDIKGMDGFEIIVLIRDFYKETPIFVLGLDTNITTILKAYDLGCNDYLKKPFDVRELSVKLDKYLNLKNKITKLTRACSYDRLKRIFYNQGNIIPLTRKETLLLHILVQNLGQTVGIEQIELFVWGEPVNDTYVRQLISRIRRKIGWDIVKNDIGNGYKIDSKIKLQN